MDENFTSHEFANYPPVDSNELMYTNPNNEFDEDFMNSIANSNGGDQQDLNHNHQTLPIPPAPTPNSAAAAVAQPPIGNIQPQQHHDQNLLQHHQYPSNGSGNPGFNNSPQNFPQSLEHASLGLDQPFNQQGLQNHYTDLDNLHMGPQDMSGHQQRHSNLTEPTNKRTRASGEVLALLVSEFNKNANPNSATRKRLSEQTNMPERSVRIWFQNRRAKSRKIEKAQADHADINGDSQSLNAAAAIYTTRYDNIPTTLNNNYYFIDVKTLTVGSWKRIKSGHLSQDNLQNVRNLSNLSPSSINEIMHNSTDLMILISKKNNEINYFFSAITENSKILFRIFFPISSINNCSITTLQESDESVTPDSFSSSGNINASSIANCDLKLFLNKSPKFAVAFAHLISSSNNQWSICDDFSEGHQVNDAFIGGGTGIPHVLSGSLNSLKFMNSHILDYKSTNTQEQEFKLPSRFDTISPSQNPLNQFAPQQPPPPPQFNIQQQQQQHPPLLNIPPHFNPSVFTDSSTAPTTTNGGAIPQLDDKNALNNMVHENNQSHQGLDSLMKTEAHESFDAFIHQDFGSNGMDLTPQNY